MEALLIQCTNSSNNKLLNFTNLTTNTLDLIHEHQKSMMIKLNDKVAGLDKNNLTYYDCFEYNMVEESKYALMYSLIDFEVLHSNKEIREKSTELNKALSSFAIDQNMRQDVFMIISHYYQNQYNDEKINLTQEQIKYVEKTMIGYKMLGLNLDEEKREKVKEINKKISSYGSDYSKNLANVMTEFEFDLTKLEGMSEDWLKNRYNSETNKYIVKLQYPDYIPIMEYCKISSTRKFMLEEMGSRCVETNLPILLDTIKLRKEKAEIFGFKSHSDYKLQNMMASNSQTVNNFLERLVELTKPLVKADKQKLIELAKELDNIDEIKAWDSTYYSRIYTEKESGLDMQELKKLFTIESVTNGIFSIYQELLGLKFIDITENNAQALYSPEIKLYCVYNFDDENLVCPMGYFYLDLFPRDGKYGHAAMFPFINKSKYNLPLAAIVCNFDPCSNVDFDNVVTYFHEFGHLMHNMVSECQISSLSGTSCQADFVETPSQMFEEWCYCEEPLKKLVLPDFIDTINKEFVQKINKQNKQMQGIFNARQLTFGILDQTIHSENIPENTWEFHNKITKELLDWEISPKANMLANWGHMFGYDALYYGYLWSKVYAIDLFSFFQSNPLDKVLGMKLRKEILSKGGTLDGLDLLKNFMNREPNPNAYIQWLSEENNSI